MEPVTGPAGICISERLGEAAVKLQLQVSKAAPTEDAGASSELQ